MERPDDLMEQAKLQAGEQPDTEICIDLNDKEIFKVTYDSQKDTFLCSRSFKTQQN